MRKGSGWAPALSGQIQWGMLTIGRFPDTVKDLRNQVNPRQDTPTETHTKTGSDKHWEDK